MRVGVILVAAGRSERAGAGLPKPLRNVAGRPMAAWSVDVLREAPGFVGMALVVQENQRAAFAPLTGGDQRVQLVAGGATRTASVAAGVAALRSVRPDVVLIHDAARPGVNAAVIQSLLDAITAGADAVAPALPMADAIKRVDGDGRVLGGAPRVGLMRVQTPQALRFEPFSAALAAASPDVALDDDLAVIMSQGGRTVLTPGRPELMKATYPEDFPMLDAVLGSGWTPRVGNGVDAHRFGPGSAVTLCGVSIPFDRGLVGHSDADVAWHALTDALLGAIAAGDIGDHFPPTDPQWRGVESGVFLRHAATLVRAASARIVNVDVTILCERPKIKPHREAMRAATAAALELPIDAVSVKATTTEKMGFLGREEGLAAQASAMVLVRS